jgi:Flp pilus assembly protein TadG
VQNKLFCHRTKLAKIVGRLKRLGEDQRGTIAVMMAFLFPILIAGFGLGYEITNWFLQTRSMRNAADAAAIAAASNGSDNYNVEATAVAAQYGFVNGSNNVTVTASTAAACRQIRALPPVLQRDNHRCGAALFN